MSNRRRRNEEEDYLEAEDNNKRPRNNQDKDEDEEQEEKDEDDRILTVEERLGFIDESDDEPEAGAFRKKKRNYFTSECQPYESDFEDQDQDDNDDCGYISDYYDDHPLKEDENVHVDPHSGFIGDLVDELPVKEDDDQEEHDALERRIEARRSPKMCCGQKEVDIDEEKKEKGENRDSERERERERERMCKRKKEEWSVLEEEDDKRRRLDKPGRREDDDLDEPNLTTDEELAPHISHHHHHDMDDDDTDEDDDTEDEVEDDYAVPKMKKDMDPDYVAAMIKHLEELQQSNIRSTETYCDVAFCSLCHHHCKPHGYVLPIFDEYDTDKEQEENVETDPDIGIVMEKDDRMPRELVEQVWALPDILVTVHKPRKDSSIGVVQQVLPDGSFKIALGSSGNGEVIIAVKNEIEIVEPRVSDKVKIMATSHRGATGKVIGIEEGDAIVRLDGDTTNLILKMSIVAKLA